MLAGTKLSQRLFFSGVCVCVCVEKKLLCRCVKMCKVKMLRSFINQRLTAAAEEIFELFEGTIAEYEEQLRSKEENERQHKLLDAALNPEVRLHRLEVQQLLLGEEEVPPEQKERSSSLDQEDPPEPPHIKEDQEELWSSQDREQLQEPEAAHISMFVFTPVPVKREDDVEKPQTSQLLEIQTEESKDTQPLKEEAGGGDCGGSGADRDFNPHMLVQPVTHDKTSHSDSEDNNSLCDWKGTFKTVSDIDCGPGRTSLSSSDCATSFGQNEHPQENKALEREVRLFSCSFCGKRYMQRAFLRKHLKCHSEENCFSCSICQKSFKLRGMLLAHMRIHTEEKPFSCSVGATRFSVKSNLISDLNLDTGGKLYTCSVCKMSFRHIKDLFDHAGIHTGRKCVCSVCGKKIQKRSLKRHMRIHTGEKHVTCSVCGKRFLEHGDLKRHLLIHKGEKAFSCPVCGKRFTQKGNVKRHLLVHTGEKPFSCSICGKSYSENKHLKRHSKVHTVE